jgi:hypothetical protein
MAMINRSLKKAGKSVDWWEMKRSKDDRGVEEKENKQKWWYVVELH